MAPTLLLIGLSLASLGWCQEEAVDPIEALSEAIPGSPGEDYPIYATPPETSFGCDGYIEGYYADPEAECQAFHICANFGDANLVKYSFLCPNGTLFNQQYFICDWWVNVDCSQAEDLYGLNEEVAAAAAAATAAAAGYDSGDANGAGSETLSTYTALGADSNSGLLATGVQPPIAPRAGRGGLRKGERRGLRLQG